MKLMKNVLLSTSLFSAALVFSAMSFASEVPIYNNNFDSITLYDGQFSSIIHNWEVAGRVSIHNPTTALFAGEGGAGAHNNTLHMIEDSSAWQTLAFKGIEYATYNLSFDVGQRYDVGACNYSIKVSAGDTVLIWATNPELPSSRGSFKHVNLQFATKGLPDAPLTVEIETYGIGHLHFDNFNLSFEVNTETQGDHYRTVAHYMEIKNTQTHAVQCVPLSDELNGVSYLSNGCQCLNSKTVWAGYSTSDDKVLQKRHYYCIKHSND